jgi:Xaa-Pro dipeptidase
VREAIGGAGLDWLVAIHPVSIHWLTGSDAKSYQEFQCLLISAKPGPLVILTRRGEVNEFRDDALVDEIRGYGGSEPDDPIEAFERVAKEFGLFGKRIGIEVPGYYLHPHQYVRLKGLLGESLVAEPTNLINDLKLVKSPQELKYIREAARIGDEAMEVFRREIREGSSELELAGDVYRALMTNGSGLAASPINLVTGERTCFSHGMPTERRLRRGDDINIEYGATYKRYTSTIGRQYCLGKASQRIRELYDVVRRASDAMIAEIRDGVPAVQPHETAKRIISEAGYGDGRVHLSGYGLAPGFPPGWSEPLHLFGGSAYTLRAGMVVTIEPPVFLGSEERRGVRLIDNVLVTEQGCEVLSTIGRELRDVG